MSIGYTPSAWGSAFHQLPHDEVLGAGAAGVGKTRVLLMDPLAQIIGEHKRCQDPNHPYRIGWGESVWRALHLRRTVKELDQSIGWMQQLFSKIDPGAHWSNSNTECTFSSGYKYRFGHCKDRDDWIGYLGWEFTHISYDELITFEEEQYDQINTRLRTSDPVLAKMLRIRSMSNPMMPSAITVSVRNPGWVRKRFIDPAPEGKVTLWEERKRPDGTLARKSRMYFPGTLDDNPDKDFAAQYRDRLLLSAKHIREALLYGNWYFTAGSFYGEAWERSRHVCKPFKVPNDWAIFRSMDWGYKQPGCIHWWAMDGDEDLFCIKEVTFRGKDVEEVALIIQQVEREMGLWQGPKATMAGQPVKGGRSMITGPADTQLWEDRGDIGLSKAAIMEKNGVPWVRAEKTAGGGGRKRKTNADKLTFRLKDNRGGKPGIVFFKTCEKAIQTIPMIQTNQDMPDEPLDGGDDHWHDSVLYACAFASYGRAGIGGRSMKKATDEWDDDVRPKRHDRGRDGYGGRL